MSTIRARHVSEASEASAPSRLPNPLGGERRTWMWRGRRIAYAVRGHGEAIVFVHAIHAAAWSAEWRHTVPALEEHRCFALDLLGFGASDRPPVHYTAPLYLQLLHDFLVEVVGEPALLVGSSLGGTYSIAIAADHPELVRGVVAVGPAGVSRLYKLGGAPFGVLENTFRTPVVGAALFKALVSRPCIRWFLKDIYYFGLDADAEALYWQSANQPNARFAPAAFVGMHLNWDIRSRITQVTCPMLIAWGTQASQTPFREARQVQLLVPHAEFVAFECGDLPHEELPQQFAAMLHAFAGRLAPASLP